MSIREYLTHNGKSPFQSWLKKLDRSTRARIQARVLRFEEGNLGDHKLLSDGVWEARFMFGSGYRVYFGKHGQALILLLVGGDKRSQKKDIERAIRYWAEYMEDQNDDEAK